MTKDLNHALEYANIVMRNEESFTISSQVMARALLSVQAENEKYRNALRIQSMMREFCDEKGPTASENELRAILYNITGMAEASPAAKGE